jgi:Flp pilus assembly protein TadD
MQCHLETTSSPLPDSIRRFGRDVRSYRPGEPLGDYKLYFDHAPGAGYEDKFEIAHAAYRLRQSACFQKSAMTCTTCHDPHRARRGGEAAGCRQCHTGPHHPETTCIDCHMPKRRAEDAIHVAMTDHFIRRRPAAKASVRREPASYRGEVALYYPAALPPGPESEAYLAVAQVRHGANLDGGIPRLEAAILKLAPAEPEFYFELGMAYSKKGNEEEAARRFEEALRRRPGFRPAVKGLAASLLALRRFGEAAALLERQTDADARMLTNRGQALLELGRTEEAVAVLERALASNPDLAEPHDLLGLAWVRRGDDRRAESEFRLALVAQPDLATAHANLGSLMARRRDLAQARYHFTRALEIDPGASETHRNYAFLLILLRDYAGARREFETAARLAPTNPLAWVDLAELEAAAGRDEKAAAAYRAALERSPRLAEAHLGLGKLLAQRGEVREAIGHLRAAVESAPGMAEARAALGILLLREGRESEARAHLEAAARSDDAAVRNLAVKALASRGSPISRERPASSPPP